MVSQINTPGGADGLEPAAVTSGAPRPRHRSIMGRLLEQTDVSICLGVLLVALLVCFIGPLFTPDPNRVEFDALLAPSLAHPMGTDALGRDLFARVLVGGRISLVVGIAVAGLCLVSGLLVGGLAGYYGGVMDWAMMKLSEIFQVLPTIMIALVAVALWGQSMIIIVMVLALTMWPPVARIARIETVRISQMGYVESARCAGFGGLRILVSDVLPNALAPVVASATITAGWAILLESGLSFLGMGDANRPSWGGLLNAARDHIDTAWWLSLFPGFAIVVVVVAINMLGDALNAAFNPTIGRVK